MDWEPVKCLIPHHLRRLRKSQRWLADQVGESEQQISNYVTMKRILGLVKARKYAHILGCHIEELYKWRYVGDLTKGE